MGNEIRTHTSTSPAATVQASIYSDSDEDPTYDERRLAFDRFRVSAPRLGKWLFEIAYPGEKGQGTNFRALAKKIQEGRGRIIKPDDIDKTFKEAIEDRRCILRHRKHLKNGAVVDGTVVDERMETCQEILDGYVGVWAWGNFGRKESDMDLG